MKHITRKNLLLIILTLLSFTIIFISNYPKFNNSPFFFIGALRLPSSTKAGVLSGTLSLLCFLLVFTDYKTGFKIGILVNVIALGCLIIGMIRVHSIVSMPGVVSSFVSFIILITFYNFYSKISESNVTDYITGQGNRRGYVKAINDHIESKKSFTLACIELEDFKHLNDLYGIQTGDYLIKKTADKLSEILDKNDKMFRITGSKLAILFEPGESPEERLKNVISSETVYLPSTYDSDNSIEMSCTISLGAGVVYSHPPYNFTKTASSVLRDAETALSATRNMASKKICIYNESMKNEEAKMREAEFLIKEALQNNYFYLVYQPQFTIGDRKLRGFESLIRCRKPDCTIVNPVEFIPVAEKTNLIMKIDDFALRSAMTEFKPILSDLENDFIISVNVSAKSMSNIGFSDKVKKMIDEIQFPAEKLEIEITEYSFAESVEATIANINSLREIGVHIALDDFGTGYTSIKQLMTLPINLLKIDKSLIDDIEDNQSMRDMVDSVIYMGHIMNCDVISEGVEKEGQLDILRDHKCDFVQGFVWGKPIDLEEAKTMCQQEEL